MRHHDRRHGKRRPRGRPGRGEIQPPPADLIIPPPPEAELPAEGAQPTETHELPAASERRAPTPEAAPAPLATQAPAAEAQPAPPEPPPPAFAPGANPDLWLVVALLVLAAVAFLPALSGDFVWDDHELVQDNPLLRSAANIPAIFQRSFLAARPNSYHPLATLSYLTDYQVWRLNPEGYHTTNLTLHLVATLLVYVIATVLLRRRDMAFAAAALFAVHPVHIPTVAWVAARPQLLATCFALFALLAYTYYVGSFQEDPGLRRRAPIYYWLAVVAFTLALFAHAAAAALLILLPLYEIALARQRLARGAGARLFLPYLGFAAGGVLYLVARWSALGYHLAVGFDVGAWPAHIYTAVVFGVRAIGLLILPVQSQIYHLPQLIATPLRVDFLVALAAMIVIITVAMRLRLASAAAALGAWWALLSLALTLNLIPLPDPQYSERDLYLPSVGMAIVLGWAFVRAGDFALARRLKWLLAVTGVLFAAAIGAGVGVSWQRSAWYRDDVALFSRMVRSAPGLALPHFDLGNAYLVRGETGRAIREYRLALKIRPGANIFHNLGNAYMDEGRYEEAVDAYRNALALNPESRASADALTQALRAQRGELGARRPSKADAAPPPGS